MKVIIIGSTGTIGSAVSKELAQRHDVVNVGHKQGDVTVDITDIESIEKMYATIGKIDAVVATTGSVQFRPLSQMTAQDYNVGIKSKLMGQVNLVLVGLRYINAGGSFTLTSGILNQDPIRTGSSASMVNAAIEGFVIGAAIELANNVRINAVSPTVLTESLPKYGAYFHGFESAPASRVALAYSKSVEGAQTGKVYQVW